MTEDVNFDADGFPVEPQPNPLDEVMKALQEIKDSSIRKDDVQEIVRTAIVENNKKIIARIPSSYTDAPGRDTEPEPELQIDDKDPEALARYFADVAVDGYLKKKGVK